MLAALVGMAMEAVAVMVAVGVVISEVGVAIVAVDVVCVVRL